MYRHYIPFFKYFIQRSEREGIAKKCRRSGLTIPYYGENKYICSKADFVFNSFDTVKVSLVKGFRSMRTFRLREGHSMQKGSHI